MCKMIIQFLRLGIVCGAALTFFTGTARAQDVNIRVIHTVYDAPAVDVLYFELPGISNVAYGESSGYTLGVSSGPANFKVVPMGMTSPVVFEADLNLAANTDYTIFAVPPFTDDNLVGAVVTTDEREPDASMAKVRFVHLSDDAPNVDIKVGDGASQPVFGNVGFEDATDYAAVGVTDYTFVVTAAGSTEPVVTFQPVALAAGFVYTVVAHGTLDPNDAYPFAVRVFVDNGFGVEFLDLQPAIESASVRVLHTSYDAPAVDILVNDVAAIEDLAYGSSSGYAELPADTYDVKVVPANATDPIVFETDLTLMSGTEYSLFAVPPLGDDNTIGVALAIDDRSPDQDNAKVRFAHLSDDAPNVDIRANDPLSAPVFANVGFETITEYAAIPPGGYGFIVSAAGSSQAVVQFQEIQVEAGSVYTVVAHGTLNPTDNFPFAVRVFIDNGDGDTFVDLEVQTSAKVRVIHTSYDAPAVDALINDTPALVDIEYGESTGYAEVPADQYNIKVTPTGETMPVVFEADLTLEENKNYTLLAVPPLGDDSRIGVLVAEDANQPDNDRVKVRFAHLVDDAPNVDIKVGDPASAPVFGDAGFESITDYIAVDPGSYGFVVTAAGQNTAVVKFKAVDLQAGSVLTVVAHGTLNPDDVYPFAVRVFIDTGDGNQFLDLEPDIASSVDESGRAVKDGLQLKASPNPVADATTIEYTISSATAERVELVLYDAMMRKVQVIDSGLKQAGGYTLQLRTADFATGAYYLALHTEKTIVIKPLSVVK